MLVLELVFLKLLGVMINSKDITADPSKVSGITDFPEPTTRQSVMHSLG